jgi:hypothetical protein
MLKVVHQAVGQAEWTLTVGAGFGKISNYLRPIVADLEKERAHES